MPERAKPDLPHLAVVSVARSDTAEQMIRLALSLVEPKQGSVIALTVVEGEGEAKTKTSEALEPLVRQFQDAGHHVELVTELATSVSRGILDATRDRGADLLIMGVQQPQRQQIKLGAVVDNCVQAAPCDVIIYRMSDSPAYHRILLPIDYGNYHSASVRMAARLAYRHQIPLRLYIQRNYIFPIENEAELDKQLSILPPHMIEKVYPTYNIARRILSDSGPDDLIMLGFSQKAELSQQIHSGDLNHQILNKAEGPVLLVSQLAQKETIGGFLQRQYYRWNPTLTKVEQSEIIWQGQKSAEPTLDYIMMIVLSAALATFGLLANSPAVIIGAMLVAPLMQPLAALAIGLVRAQIALIQRASITLIQGVMVALLLSILLGRLVNVESPTSEMLARGTPSLLDAGVALVSGLVAAYAISRKDIPAALAGVAIAAALMPPICTIGLGIAAQDAALASGAALLFLTNIAFIVGAESLIFLWMGLRPAPRQNNMPLTGLWWAGLTFIIVIVVSVLFNLGQQAHNESAAYARLSDIFAPAQVIAIEKRRTNPLEIIVTLRGRRPISAEQITNADAQLQTALGEPIHLEVIQLATHDASDAKLMAHFQAYLPTAHVSAIHLEANALSAHIMTEDDLSPETLSALSRAIEKELGYPVELVLTVDRVVRLRHTPPETTPEPTDETNTRSEIDSP